MSKYSAMSFVIILLFSSCVNYTQNIETVDVLNSSSRDDYTQINVVTNFTSHPPIATGDSTTCVILNDKNISCWGANWNGKLGNGSLDSYSSNPVKVLGLPDNDGAVQVEVGSNVACTVLESGRLFCWGRGGYVGDGTFEDRSIATEVLTNDNDVMVSKVVIGSSHACALISNGSVMCWGQEYEGKLGDGVERGTWDIANTPNYTAPLPDGRLAVDIGVDTSSTCAVLDNGSISCWGRAGYTLLRSYENNQPNVGYSFGNGITVESITSYGGKEDGRVSGMCVILSNDTVSCWHGSLKDSYSFSPHSPVMMAIGARHACVLLSDSSIRCWGDNDFGQIGDGTWESKGSPITIQGFDNQDPIISISAGIAITCAVTSSGKVYCWGSNSLGAVGDGTVYGLYEKPVKIDPLLNVTEIIYLPYAYCAKYNDGHIGCWGDNEWGIIGDGSTEDRSIRTIYHHSNSYFGGSIVDIQSRDFRVCVLIDDVSIWCWEGERNRGALPEKLPHYGSTRFATSFAVGNDFICAVQDNGEVSCSGYGHYGAIGDGNWDDRENPTTTEEFGNNNPAIDISTSGSTLCALTENSEVWCWGYNAGGELGDESTDWARNSPGKIPFFDNLDPVVNIESSGYGNFCVLIENGDVYCWGSNYDASLGDGTRNESNVPVKVIGIPSPVNDLSSTSGGYGIEPYCALIDEKQIYCWGDQWDNEIEPNGAELFWDNSNISSSVHLMSKSPCFQSLSDDIWCWGYHDFVDADFNRTSPTQVNSFGLELHVETQYLDSDYDGVPNVDDNCPKHTNLLQQDWDQDGMGDTCDLDDDNDGFLDEEDDCPYISGISTEGALGCPDSDEDGVIDLNDLCPNTIFYLDTVNEFGCALDEIDSDEDGIMDIWDLCEGHPDEVDIDGNGIPDGCDDSDGDGIIDTLDICPDGDDNFDSDGDGIPDACEITNPEPVNETNITDVENKEILDNTSSESIDVIWILLSVLSIISIIICSVFVIGRKKKKEQIDSQNDPVEVYTRNMVELGYDEDAARQYAEQYYATYYSQIKE